MGRRISGRTVGQHTSQGRVMLAAGTARLHKGEAVLPGLPGACPSRPQRLGAWWAFSLSFRCRCRLSEVRSKMWGRMGPGSRLSIPTCPLLRLPHTPDPREVGPPRCMIRFLNSRLAAAPRGSMYCLLPLLMEQFCLACSAAHYYNSISQETRATRLGDQLKGSREGLGPESS